MAKSASTSTIDVLHGMTHLVPGVPEHVDHPAGHHGRPNRPHHPQRGHHQLAHTRINHPAKPPRVLVGWQRRIAALFGQWI